MTEKEIIDGYSTIMNGNLYATEQNWNKVGEYYQQFSIYTEEYVTHVTNKI